MYVSVARLSFSEFRHEFVHGSVSIANFESGAFVKSSVTDPLPKIDIFLASRPVFGIVVALLVHFQRGSARQRPRTLLATSTFPRLRGDLRARSDSI
jgi:hypothetical protein